MPKQGQSVETCIITSLKKKVGDKVAAGEILFSYETDKASFDEESKFDGTVLAVFCAEGDEVPVLSNMMVIGAEGEDVSAFAPSAGAPAAPEASPEALQPVEAAAAPETAPAPAVEPGNAGGPASPRARKLAAEKGVNLATVAGTGPSRRHHRA